MTDSLICSVGGSTNVVLHMLASACASPPLPSLHFRLTCLEHPRTYSRPVCQRRLDDRRVSRDRGQNPLSWQHEALRPLCHGARDYRELSSALSITKTDQSRHVLRRIFTKSAACPRSSSTCSSTVICSTDRKLPPLSSCHRSSD